MPAPASVIARNTAIAKLIERNHAEFAELLAAERVKVGLPAQAQRGRGPSSVERAPVAPILAAIRPAKVVDRLGVSRQTWAGWVRKGVPVTRKADVAAAVELPESALWPDTVAA